MKFIEAWRGWPHKLVLAALPIVVVLSVIVIVVVNNSNREAPSTDVATRGAKSYARSLVSNPSYQFPCLNSLWTNESGWYVKADNPTSSAYGIPQALPGSKMAAYGSDWRWNYRTQVKWGINYIKTRYGSMCNAWSHFKRNNWY